MFLKVKDPKGYRFAGKHMAEGDVHEARDREGNLLIAIGKAEKVDEPKKNLARKAKKDYQTRDMKAD